MATSTREDAGLADSTVEERSRPRCRTIRSATTSDRVDVSLIEFDDRGSADRSAIVGDTTTRIHTREGRADALRYLAEEGSDDARTAASVHR